MIYTCFSAPGSVAGAFELKHGLFAAHIRCEDGEVHSAMHPHLRSDGGANEVWETCKAILAKLTVAAGTDPHRIQGDGRSREDGERRGRGQTGPSPEQGRVMS
jgi:hypothetical protein